MKVTTYNNHNDVNALHNEIENCVDNVCTLNEMPFPDECESENVNYGTARRQFSRFDGIYVEGRVNNFDIVFTLDTGCSRSILSADAYNSMSVAQRPTLIPKPSGYQVLGADGNEIQSSGSILCTVQLGESVFTHTFNVANIKDECLLGADVLLHSVAGPIDIVMSQRKIVIDNVDVPIIVQDKSMRNPINRKVSVAGNVTIPAMSRCIVNVYVEKDPEGHEMPCTIVSNEHVVEKHNVFIPHGIIDPCNDPTPRVIVMNPSDNDVTLYADTVVAHVDALCDISQDADADNTSDFTRRSGEHDAHANERASDTTHTC